MKKITRAFMAMALMLCLSLLGTGKVQARDVQHYDLDNSGTWTGSAYTLNGKLITDAFFCDGTYTYYLQADGTPMTDRLTYHPDGEHVIYFDANGHEVFSDFMNVKKSIAGDAVDDLCFFDVYGYMYTNKVTYNKEGTNLYYANPYGVIERSGWFTFAEDLGGIAQALGVNAGDQGYANGDGSLATNCDVNDASGKTAHIQSNGVAITSSTSMIASVSEKAAIEADVTLNPTGGTGSHAKLVICTAQSAISFGIQYDSCAVAPYTGKTMALMENIGSNAAGGQSYVRPGDRELALGQTYHMMLTVDEYGSGHVYLDNECIGSYSNPGLAHQVVYLRVEASARLNGDQVNATFKNIKVKNFESYDPTRSFATHEFQTNPTINNTVSAWNDISFSGYVSGLGAGEDWDNRFGDVSDIIQFVY